jgi:hypothetical protein
MDTPDDVNDVPDDVYFEGDPEFDSRRRHLERVLKGGPPRRKWPWVLALAAGGGAWALWRVLQRDKREDAGKTSAIVARKD